MYNLVDPLSSSSAQNAAANANGGTNVLTKDGRPNKGTILSRSVDYIRYLQGVIDDQNCKELELQEYVQSLQRQLGVEVTQFGPTSAELALARIRGEGMVGTDDDPNSAEAMSDELKIEQRQGVLSPGAGDSLVMGQQQQPQQETPMGFTPDYDSAMADEFLVS